MHSLAPTLSSETQPDPFAGMDSGPIITEGLLRGPQAGVLPGPRVGSEDAWVPFALLAALSGNAIRAILVCAGRDDEAEFDKL